MRIGIPRALYYYRYGKFWTRFWQELGCEVVISSPTSKNIMDWGVSCAVDGTCLPVKVYYGHVHDLVRKEVDYLFVPQIISTQKHEYICPKFMGLPDMVEHSISGNLKLIAPVIDARKGAHSIMQAYLQAGRSFASWSQVMRAYRSAIKEQHKFEKQLQQGVPLNNLLFNDKIVQPENPKLTIGLLGHEYLIYDQLMSMGVLERLVNSGYRIITAEEIDDAYIEHHSSKLPKRMFWTSGKRMLGALGYLHGKVDGLISMMAFACGTDSLTTELLERYSHRENIPFLLLSLDEHTGEAGVVTRIEAFLDMLERRETLESNRSAHG